jgi:hypothetical protein
LSLVLVPFLLLAKENGNNFIGSAFLFTVSLAANQALHKAYSLYLDWNFPYKYDGNEDPW